MWGNNNSNANKPQPMQDREVQNPPDDCVTALSWSPDNNYMLVTSWDNKFRVYQVANDGSTQGKLQNGHDRPILDGCWDLTGAMRVFTAGCDHKAFMWDLNTNQSSQIAQHDAPIRVCRAINMQGNQIVATCGWDKKINYWDTRSPNPVGSVTVSERIYCGDFAENLGVVCTADRQIYVYDLRNPGKEFNRRDSPLKYQTRCVAAFPDQNGFALGSIEGRVAIEMVNSQSPSEKGNFAFKCHRDGSNVYAVNAISFNRQHGSFATCGSDGYYHFWDKDNRSRLQAFDKRSNPVVAGAFSPNGHIFAYALSYDWSKGATGYQPGSKTQLFLHPVSENEVKKKDSANNNRRRG